MQASGVMQAVMPASAGTPTVEQQTWPEAPHVLLQVPAPLRPVGLSQPSPLLHTSFAQQAWPAAPHGVQAFPASDGRQASAA
jgi:hypothetical protein